MLAEQKLAVPDLRVQQSDLLLKQRTEGRIWDLVYSVLPQSWPLRPVGRLKTFQTLSGVELSLLVSECLCGEIAGGHIWCPAFSPSRLFCALYALYLFRIRGNRLSPVRSPGRKTPRRAEDIARIARN